MSDPVSDLHRELEGEVCSLNFFVLNELNINKMLEFNEVLAG
jgi:hypothetical protein